LPHLDALIMNDALASERGIVLVATGN